MDGVALNSAQLLSSIALTERQCVILLAARSMQSLGVFPCGVARWFDVGERVLGSSCILSIMRLMSHHCTGAIKFMVNLWLWYEFNAHHTSLVVSTAHSNGTALRAFTVKCAL